MKAILDKKPEELLEEYSRYENVAPEGIEEKPWFNNRMMPILYEIPYGSRVLDVGANVGDFVEALKRDRKCDAYGVDISDVCVEEAIRKGRNVQKADAHKLPFPDHYFDCVCLMEVLVHVHSQIAVLEEIKRVLKPNGFLLGSTPHKNLQDKVWEEKFSHHDYPDEKSLEQILLSVFDKAYIRVLTGGQFSFTMASSIVGKDPAEMLFKCGGKKTLDWEEALLDKSILRVWMGFTAAPADVYYRMSGYADKMREKGAEIAYEPYNPQNLESTGRWQSMVRFKHVQRQFDAILKCADFSIWQIVHTLDCVAFLRCIKDVFKKPVFTEIDDWLFDIPSSNMASNPYKPGSDAEWAAYEQIKNSDGVIVSTKFLKDNLEEMFPGKPVYVVKNSIDFLLWDNLTPYLTIPEKKEGVVRISYSGCGNHNADVEIVKNPLLALLDEFPNLEIVFSQQFDSWKDINHERIHYVNRWVPMTIFPSMLKGWDSDIGIAPLRDNNLNRAKSNLRWLEYSALKVPTVCSKVVPFQESIINGQTGYLCNSKKEWYERLKALIQSKEERERIGQNAYREVKVNFNMDKVSEGYLELLKQVKKEALCN